MKSPDVGHHWWGCVCDSKLMRCFLWAYKVRKDPLQFFVTLEVRVPLWVGSTEGHPAPLKRTEDPPCLGFLTCECIDRRWLFFPVPWSPYLGIQFRLALSLIWIMLSWNYFGPLGRKWASEKKNLAFRNKNPYWGKGIEEQLLCKEESGPWSPLFLSPALIWRYFTVGFWRGGWFIPSCLTCLE